VAWAFLHLTCRCYVRSDEEMAAERPRKAVPSWARRCAHTHAVALYNAALTVTRHSEALAPVLYAQAKADPDSIFQNPSKTCRCVIPASDALPVRC
jgi:hypothetical protein